MNNKIKLKPYTYGTRTSLQVHKQSYTVMRGIQVHLNYVNEYAHNIFITKHTLYTKTLLSLKLRYRFKVN